MGTERVKNPSSFFSSSVFAYGRLQFHHGIRCMLWSDRSSLSSLNMTYVRGSKWITPIASRSPSAIITHRVLINSKSDYRIRYECGVQAVAIDNWIIIMECESLQHTIRFCLHLHYARLIHWWGERVPCITPSATNVCHKCVRHAGLFEWGEMAVIRHSVCIVIWYDVKEQRSAQHSPQECVQFVRPCHNCGDYY